MSTPRSSRIQTLCFVIEGLNSFSVVIYTYYLYFYLSARFGFHDRDNLLVAALLGLIYLVASWQGGRFAQRRGNFQALKLGIMVIMGALAVGSQLGSAAGQIAAAAALTAGQSFIWPALEALISESETPARLPHAVGMYNLTWASTNAVGFFVGGMLVQASFKNLFFVPLGVQAVELGLAFWLHNHAGDPARAAGGGQATPIAPPPDPHRPPPGRTQAFLRMAWLANPFAYIAINTLIAVIPGLAAKFDLTPMFAGFACSLWCFARLGAFAALWLWTGWHYRFPWLLGAFVILIAAFAGILTVPSLGILLCAQVCFGGAIGLIYYSSLFYSMDAGDSKGEHGGIHEAAIGLGNCVGPVTGAAALWLAPGNANMGAWAVSALLTLGLGGLCWIRTRPEK